MQEYVFDSKGGKKLEWSDYEKPKIEMSEKVFPDTLLIIYRVCTSGEVVQ